MLSLEELRPLVHETDSVGGIGYTSRASLVVLILLASLGTLRAHAAYRLRLHLSQRQPPLYIRQQSRSSGEIRTVGGLFGDTTRREISDSGLCHHPVGLAVECDGLEYSPYTRTTGNASHLAPRLRGGVGDRLQDQASIAVVLHGFRSKRHLDGFKELSYLRLRKTKHQPSQRRQKSVLVTRLQAHSRQKIRTHHLQAIPSRFIAPKH